MIPGPAPPPFYQVMSLYVALGPLYLHPALMDFQASYVFALLPANAFIRRWLVVSFRYH